MARAGCRTNGLQKLEGDDVEKSIEVLDKVLLEFEDPDSLPHIPIHLEPESPSQGNQSEDDGYMSMNGRRAKIPPEFHQPLSNESLSSPPSSSIPIMVEEKPLPVHDDDERVIIENVQSSSSPSSPVTSDESVGVVDIEEEEEEGGAKCTVTATPPPSPERAEEIISNFLPRITPTETSTDLIASSKIENNDQLNNIKNLQTQLDNKQIIVAPNNGTIIQCTNYDVIHKIQLNSDNSGAIKGAITADIINLDGKLIKDTRENDGSTVIAQQTTLPKTRPSNVIPSKYSSLPCSGPARSAFGSHLDRFGRGMGGGSFDGGGSNLNGRNILGIGISAVHDAVLRGGVAKLPEPIVNEHPVTIYPGRASPPGRRVPPRTLPGSIERHREVCRNTDPNCITNSPTSNINIDFIDNNIINNCNNIIGSTTTKIMSPLQRISITKSPSSPLVAVQQHIILQNSVSSNQLIDNKNLLNSLQIPPRKPQRNYIDNNSGGNGGNNKCGKINIDKMNYANNKINNSNKINNKNNTSDSSSSSEEFSDDSLEGQSLPPPPAPPIVPPPPSLSAPVTPSKRGSIAWEINLDDDLPPPPSIAQQNDNLYNRNGSKIKNSRNGKDKPNKLETSASAKIIARHRGRTQSGGSQSSIASTPGNSGGSISNQNSPQHHYHQHHHNQLIKNRSSSMEWPEPPTISTGGGDSAPICSTEDEAASIYSDSDDVIPSYPINMTGKGTYVIRKGRKERHRLSDIHTSMSSSINSRLSNEGSLLSGMTASQSLLVPNSRHSIDLGSSGTTIHSPISGTGNCLPTMLSPRSRLSLDLSSPNNATSDHPPVSLHTILSGGGSSNISHSNGTQLHQTHQPQHITTNNSSAVYTGDFNKYSNYETTTGLHHNQNHHHETNGNSGSCGNLGGIGNNTNNGSNGNLNNNNNLSNSTGNMNGSLTRALPSNDVISTPRRELAPPIEEDEEQDSESQSRGAPLRQIENNISALLRGDIAVARVGDIPHTRRPLGFRPGVHKSESAKEMLLSQTAFGPLPPSPPNSSPEPEIEIDAFPPLPPSPQENVADDEEEIDESDIVRGLHGIRLSSRTRLKSSSLTDPHIPPAVPPHRSSLGGGVCGVNVIVGGGVHQQPQPSLNTLKTRSMDAGYTKKYSTNSPHGSIPGTLPCEMPTSSSSRRRLQSGAFPKRAAQSPREERRLQTSCSLPETPIFARGCDIPRTPHRRAPEIPCPVGGGGGSRTAPRTNPNTTTSLGSSIVGIGNTMGGGRRPIAGAEMLRLAGGPARGWYPKQRAMRPASTEHLDRLHRTQGSMRAWDTAIGVGGVGMSTGGMSASGGGCVGRKPLTLPPNLTPKFFNKSPREALRRVTSLLIKKGNGKDKDKESKHRDKEVFTTSSVVHRSPGSAGDIPINQIYINNGTATSSSTASSTNHQNQTQHKKKGFFKNFWKKSKHYSLDQQ